MNEHRKAVAAISIAVAVIMLLTAARTRPSRPPAPPAKPLSATRSLEITDQAIVGAFGLDRIFTSSSRAAASPD